MVPKTPLPKLFIGSSREGRPVAEALQQGLEHDFEATIWDQGFFTLSRGYLESLCTKCRDFDFAVLVLTHDDVVVSRDVEKMGPRDNVIFELGLFMGSLGRDRTFIVYNRNEDIKIPTDLVGVALAGYPARTDNNLRAALGPACAEIRSAAVEAGARLLPTELDLGLELVRLSPTEVIVAIRRGNRLPFLFDHLLFANGKNPGGIPFSMATVHGDAPMTVHGPRIKLHDNNFPYELTVKFKAIGILPDPMKIPPKMTILQKWMIFPDRNELIHDK